MGINPTVPQNLDEILYHFSLNPGHFSAVLTPWSNENWLLTNEMNGDLFLLSKWKKSSASDLKQVNENLAQIKSWIRQSDKSKLRMYFPEFVLCEAGLPYYTDSTEEKWRLIRYSTQYQRFKNCPSTEMAYHAGVFLARFQEVTDEFPIDEIYTKSDIHDVEYQINLLPVFLKQAKPEQTELISNEIDLTIGMAAHFLALEKTFKSDFFDKKPFLNIADGSKLVYDTAGNCTGLADYDLLSAGNRLIDYGLIALYMLGDTVTDLNFNHFTAFSLGYLSRISFLLSDAEKVYLPHFISYTAFVFTMDHLALFISNEQFDYHLVMFRHYCGITQEIIKQQKLIEQIIQRCLIEKR